MNLPTDLGSEEVFKYVYQATDHVRDQIRRVSDSRVRVVPREEISSHERNDEVVMIDFRIRLQDNTMLEHESTPGSAIRAVGLKNESATEWSVQDVQLRFGDPQEPWDDHVLTQRACNKAIENVGDPFYTMVNDTGYIGFGDSGNPPIHVKCQNPAYNLLEVVNGIVDLSREINKIFSKEPSEIEF